MPSQKPRIALTLDDDLQSVIDDISRITKTPKATIITDILRNSYPALDDLRNALVAVEQKKDVFPHLARISAFVNTETANLNGNMLNLAEMIAKGGKND
jgi:IMP cyclohydrolase